MKGNLCRRGRSKSRHTAKESPTGLSTSQLGDGAPLRLAGIYNCGQTIIKEEGVRSLWKGLTPFAVHLTLKYALRMGTNAFYQSLLRDQVRM